MSSVEQRPRERIAIVGGGISGLSAAYRLIRLAEEQDRNLEVRLFEASTAPGGQIRTERVEGLLFEGGPDSIVTQKPAGVGLCRELGLESEMIPLDGPTLQLLHRNRLLQLPDGFALVAPSRWGPLIGSKLFSWPGKLRMASGLLRSHRGAAIEDESVQSFVTRCVGREAYERVAEPVFGGLFTADAEKMSAEMALPRFRQMERTSGSLLRSIRALAARRADAPAEGSNLVALEGGMGRLVERIVSQLPDGCLKTGAPIESIEHDTPRARWIVHPRGLEPYAADALILTCPAFAAERLLRPLDEQLSADLERLDYASCATVNLVYDRARLGRPLESYGFFVPRTASLPVLACAYVSAKFVGRFPENLIVLRVFMGGALHPEILDHDDDRLIEEAHRTVADLLRIDGRPHLARLYRNQRSMPQYRVGQRTHLASIDSRLEQHPGLLICGTATGAMGLPDCISSGDRAARQALDAASARTRGLQLAI